MALFAWTLFRVVFAHFLTPAEADQYIAGCIILAAAPCTAMVFVRACISTFAQGRSSWSRSERQGHGSGDLPCKSELAWKLDDRAPSDECRSDGGVGDASQSGKDRQTVRFLTQFSDVLKDRSVFAVEWFRARVAPAIADHRTPASVAASAVEQCL
jgi:hypothetical protein